MKILRCTEKNKAWLGGGWLGSPGTRACVQTACFLSTFPSRPNSSLAGAFAIYLSPIVAFYPIVIVLSTVLTLCFLSKCAHSHCHQRTEVACPTSSPLGNFLNSGWGWPHLFVISWELTQILHLTKMKGKNEPSHNSF